MEYRINITEIKQTFEFKLEGLHKFKFITGSNLNKMPLLPYPNKFEKEYNENFISVVAEFLRVMTGENITENFELEQILENILNKVNFENNEDREFFINFIENTFISDKNNLLIFHPRIFNFIKLHSSEHKKVANFLFTVLATEEILDLINNKSSNNILADLFLSSLPSLKENSDKINVKYFNYVPYVSKLFMEDFKFISENQNFFIKHIEKLLKYYYFFYTSQLALKLNKTYFADLKNVEQLYFNLQLESISSVRESFNKNWLYLKPKIEDLLYHVVVLEILNHNFREETFTYPEIKNIIENLNDDEKLFFSEDIENFILDLENQADIDWNEFEFERKHDNICIELIDKLYETIVYIYNKTSRNMRFSKNFTDYCENHFLESHGRSGKILTLSQDMLMFFTEISIKHKEKIPLKDLFYEFQRRGISFDFETKKSIINIFEKLNLLEKKSDSGDIQYVKSIL